MRYLDSIFLEPVGNVDTFRKDTIHLFQLSNYLEERKENIQYPLFLQKGMDFFYNIKMFCI